MSEGRERQPALRPTEPATLVVAGLAAAGVAWLLISNFYQDLPPMIWPPVLVIGGIAVLEAAVARNLWVRIHQPGRVPAGRRGRAGGEPVEPLAVARYAVLAKASSLAGAIFTGWYAGYLPWLLVESGRLPGAGADLPPTTGGLLASIALMVVALLLERACRVPEPPDGPPDEPPDGPSPPPDTPDGTDQHPNNER
ncbi:MAG: DUF3180 family protein [Micromonosporaceae bacterium]|nr:DUF3180 family protein [Micromonosporaceae bacterium]